MGRQELCCIIGEAVESLGNRWIFCDETLGIDLTMGLELMYSDEWSDWPYEDSSACDSSLMKSSLPATLPSAALEAEVLR